MPNVAVVFTNTKGSISGLNFEFDKYALTQKDLKKVLKADVDIDIDPDKYKFIVLVGSEPLKYFTRLRSIMDVSGKLIDGKFLPIINPAITIFKPELSSAVDSSINKINDYVLGKAKDVELNSSVYEGISTEERAIEYIQEVLDADCSHVAMDSETSGFDPYEGHVLGVSMAYQEDFGVYINSDAITPRVEELLQKVCNAKTVVFHNAKFDIKWLETHFGLTFPNWEDTMLIHYCGNETPGTHDLKRLAVQYTPFPFYEQEQQDWITNFCREKGVKKADFKWDWVPFDVMKKYAALDAIVTLCIYNHFPQVLKESDVYQKILKPAMLFVKDMETSGVPFDKERLETAQTVLRQDIENLKVEIRQHPKVAQYESEEGKEFNPRSTFHLGKVLFDLCGLKPIKFTATGGRSTDAEVLEELSEQHDLPKKVLDYRKKIKILTTYVDKLLISLNKDSRLRTNFNLHTTRSGRLSSSGKLNMQTIPRDDPIVKGCIKSKPGYKIVSMDLTTAEMYVAAVLSGDKELQEVFIQGDDFHSSVAKKCFQLPCSIEAVSDLYQEERQAAKAISFGILYGAGASKIALTISQAGFDCDESQASKYISDYFSSFKRLEKWINELKSEIKRTGSIYSHFKRKRRLPEAKSPEAGVRAKGLLSGVNFVVQSPASDINLLAAIEMNDFIKENNMNAKIVALVHDSILAEVKEDEVEKYCQTLKSFVQKDRGISIPNSPIGCDFDVGEDYSFGKYDTYMQKLQSN